MIKISSEAFNREVFEDAAFDTTLLISGQRARWHYWSLMILLYIHLLESEHLTMIASYGTLGSMWV